MKTAYLDCFSGVSGDMFLGAILDAGLSIEELRQVMRSLPLEGYTINAEREKRNNLIGTRFTVKLITEKYEHRNLKDIKKIIQRGDFSKDVKEKSIHIFESIAHEEGKIHDCAPDDVHFHEVGAIDSIIDIVIQAEPKATI